MRLRRTVNIGKEIAEVQRNTSIGKMDKLLLILSKEDAKSLIKVMSDLEISSRVIATVLKGNGHSVGREAVNNWRRLNVPNFETRSNHYIGRN